MFTYKNVMSLRKPHDSRCREIVRSAERIIAKNGLEALTVKRLAAEVGVTDAAIYRHFKSKEEILLAVLGDFSAPLEMVKTSILDSDRSIMEKIGMLFDEKCARVSRHPEQTIIMRSFLEFRGHRRLSKQAMEMLDAYRARFVSLIREGQDHGEIVSQARPDHLYLVITGALHALVQQWDAEGRSFDLRKEGRCLWDSLKVFLTPSPKYGGKP